MRWDASRGTSTGRRPAVSTTFPPHQPGRHGWNELLHLADTVRQLAHDTSLAPVEALGRIRDAYRDYDQRGGMQ